VLLLRSNEFVPTAKIVDELWGERPPATAVKTVQVFVSSLRKVLGEGSLETRPGGYLLKVAPEAIDCERFERLLEQGRQLLQRGDARPAGELLREGLSLWRGPPLADFQYEQFARNEVGRLEELRLVAAELRLETDLALGRHAEVAGELEALVRDHPLRERLRELLMRALYRSGRQADALAVYQDARATLVDELGLDPGHALQELEKAILRQDPALDLVAAPPSAEVREERKTVTVLLCDVVTYTEHGERLDPESLRPLVSQYLDQVATVVGRHEGTIAQFVGDEVMAVFAVSGVHDDALRAVRAAVELRDALRELGVEVRIGLNTGEVIAGNPALGRGFVTGDPVAVAKRLEQAAAPGEIVLGEATRALVGEAAEVSPAKSSGPRGGSKPVPAFRLLQVNGPREPAS
jgi:class 3 adenylate cyclase